MDELRKKSDRELEKMEKRLVKIYKDAEKDITKSWNEYMKKAEDRIAKYEEKYEQAKKSGDQDLIAKTGKTLGIEKHKVTLQDTRYKEMLAQTTEKLTHTNEIAMAYVNGQMPKIYTLNYNGTLQEIQSEVDKVGDIGFSFSLVDERTVRNLAKSDTSLFPQKTIDRAKDEKWNLKAINSQVLQGILQGESIPKIADRLQNVTDMNSKAAVRNARTMCTAAENNGRLSGMKEAEEQGIVYEKQWMATHDDRTRISHAEIDGVSVGLDEEFPNGLQYPGDPAGYAEEVYNCFVGKTKVGANSRVIRTYKHKYSGQLFTVKTASGIQFTCTPNHPILTSRGWIAANRINDGDDLFVTSVSKKPFFVTWSNPNINHVLASFDTIHKFFKVFGRKRTADLGVNFHGDIPTSEVEIVTQKRFLRNNRNTCGGKSVNKFFFILADKVAFCKSTFSEHFIRIWQSSFCDIGGKSKSFSLFGRCLRHSKIHSLRSIALLDSGRIQKSYNNGARYAQLLGNSLNGFSGIVFADKVISIDIKFSHCDVFNLQSENGYYFAKSIIPQRHRKDNNGIMVIAHNCRCSMVRELIGFRRADGSISPVEGIVDYEPEYFADLQKTASKEEKVSIQFGKLNGILQDYEETLMMDYAERMSDSDIEVFNEIFQNAEFVRGKESYYDSTENNIQLSNGEGEFRDSTAYHEGTHWFDYNQSYTITDDYGRLKREYDDDGNLIGRKWESNIVVTKENASFSEYIYHAWDSYPVGENWSIDSKTPAQEDLMNFVKIIGMSDTYGNDRSPQDVKDDLDAIRDYLNSKGISMADSDFVHLSDFMSAISFDASLGSLVSGGHSYEYWTYNGEKRVAEITAGYNLLKATGREDMINIEKELAPNLMDMIEKEWSKIWKVKS